MRRAMIWLIFWIAGRRTPSMRSIGSDRNSDATRWCKVSVWKRTRRSRTRLAVFQIQRSHLTFYGEIGVVEDERARDAIFEEFKTDRVNGRLLATLLRLLVQLVKITDRNRPAHEVCHSGHF